MKAKKTLAGNYRKKAYGGYDRFSTPDSLDSLNAADPNSFSIDKLAGGVSSGANIAGVAGGLVNGLAKADKYGVRNGTTAAIGGGLSGAATGAKLGSVAGPYGTIIGGAVGLIGGTVGGILGNNKAKKRKEQAITRNTNLQLAENAQRSDAAIARDPEASTGRLAASYYAMGGTMKGSPIQSVRTKRAMRKIQPSQDLMPNIAQVPGRQISRMGEGGNIHIKKSHEGRFTAYKERTGKTTEEALHSSDPHVRKMANFAKNAAGWKKGESGGTIPDNELPDGRFLNQYTMGANGGQVVPLSSQDARIEGRKHKDGGVKFPSAGVELEGGETVNNGFVFSDKLGFAEKQEKVAKALGKVEKMPDTPYNRNTSMALQRKTQMYKNLQEGLKAQMGIPNDLEQKALGGPIGDDPGITLTRRKSPLKLNAADRAAMAANYDPSLLGSNGKFNVQKVNGTILHGQYNDNGQWGNDPNQVQDVQLAPKAISDKAAGLDNNYTPARDRSAPHPDIPMIKSASGRNRYSMGGKLSKGYKTMAYGGPDDPKLPPNPIPGMQLPQSEFNSIQFGPGMRTQRVLPTGKKPLVISSGNKGVGSRTANGSSISSTATTKPAMGSIKFPLPDPTAAPDQLPDVPSLNVPASPVAPELAMPTNIKTQTQSSSNKKGLLSAAGDVAGVVTPFISNIANATRKLPLPPLPTLDDEITPNTVDYSASRAEAVRQTRGANKTAQANLNSGAAVTASRAANLAQQQRSIGQINEAEQNANAEIRNRTNQINAGIRASNNTKKDNYNTTLVERQLKDQQLKSENLANVEEKIQGMSRDKKLFDLEDQKVMLEALKDDTGASFRGANAIFKKHLSQESYNQLKSHFDKLEQDNAADREANRKMGKLQLDYLKKRNLNSGLTPTDVLGNISAVNTAKEDNANRKKS